MAEVAAQAKLSEQPPSKTLAVKPINNASPQITNGRGTEPSHPSSADNRELKPTKESQNRPTDSRMSSGHLDSQDGSQGIDPISRQILERRRSQVRVAQTYNGSGSSLTGTGASEYETQPAGLGPEIRSIQRVDSSASSKLTKDKNDAAAGGSDFASLKVKGDVEKGVSFLSRIMGNKKREESFDLVRDNESEVGDSRPAGRDAELFSQPLGFIPRFPAPPKYIKVKAQNRKQKDFDRLFLAQILLGDRPPKNREPSDAKITSINDVAPAPPRPHSSPNKAIWAMEWSRDGKYLAAAGQDKKLRVWAVIASSEDRESEERESETETNAPNVKLNAPVFKTKLVREYDGHTSSILDLSWSKNNFLLSSSMDKTVRLYHVSREECLCAFKHNDFVTSIAFHPRDDRFFLAGSLDAKIRLWSIPDKSVAYWAQVPDMVTAVGFTPDGATALAGCLNGLCILYATEGLKAHSQIHVKSARGRNSKGSKITGIDTISLQREDGHHDVKLLITSNDSRIRMYNLRDRNLEIKFRGNENACSQIRATFSDDGKYVICGSEDRKVYIWPTGPIEKQDPEKRPVEVFEAGSAIITTALLAPTKTRQLLAQSGDPLYDLCNPPPVTLLSRSDSVISSKAPTDATGEHDPLGPPRKSDSPRRALETPAYLARQAHPGGNVIVTADYNGSIKLFRQDCAYQKRRQESWDNGSVFSKKMLGRTGSVTTSRSQTSSLNNNRNSTSLAAKNPSTDRIINWRNSISSINGNGNGNGHRKSVSETNLGNITNVERTRSVSPKKSFSHRFSLRHSSSPSTKSPPQSPLATSPTQKQPQVVLPPSSPTTEPGATLQQPSQSPGAITPSYNPVPHDPDDPLYLQGQQSFMYWNVQNSLVPMINHEPRTPGLLSVDGSGRNPLSRRQSLVSQLSSEILSSQSSASGNDGAGYAVHPENQQREGEVRCSRCGNSTFKATTGSEGSNGAHRLRCRRCGLAV